MGKAGTESGEGVENTHRRKSLASADRHHADTYQYESGNDHCPGAKQPEKRRDKKDRNEIADKIAGADEPNVLIAELEPLLHAGNEDGEAEPGQPDAREQYQDPGRGDNPPI